MRATVQAVPASDFDSWLRSAGAARPASSELGKQEFTGVCAKCHGLAAQGGIGPNIASSAIIRRTARHSRT